MDFSLKSTISSSLLLNLIAVLYNNEHVVTHNKGTCVVYVKYDSGLDLIFEYGL